MVAAFGVEQNAVADLAGKRPRPCSAGDDDMIGAMFVPVYVDARAGLVHGEPASFAKDELAAALQNRVGKRDSQRFRAVDKV